MECWAACLGNCGGGPSREHYISDGIFDGRIVNAFGLDWCKSEPKNIGLASATAKILCKVHNQALSPFDAEAAKLSRFLTSNVLDVPENSNSIQLNGALLEKWALKTCVNLGFIGALDPETHIRVLPEPGHVRAIFGSTKAAEGAGLYFIYGKLNSEDYKNGLSWHAIRNLTDRDRIVGMHFMFNGLRFVVSLVSVRAEPLLLKMGMVDGLDFSTAKIDYRPKSIRMRSADAGEKIIELSWY